MNNQKYLAYHPSIGFVVWGDGVCKTTKKNDKATRFNSKEEAIDTVLSEWYCEYYYNRINEPRADGWIFETEDYFNDYFKRKGCEKHKRYNTPIELYLKTIRE